MSFPNLCKLCPTNYSHWSYTSFPWCRILGSQELKEFPRSLNQWFFISLSLFFCTNRQWWMIFSCKTSFQGCIHIIGYSTNKGSWNLDPLSNSTNAQWNASNWKWHYYRTNIEAANIGPVSTTCNKFPVIDLISDFNQGLTPLTTPLNLSLNIPDDVNLSHKVIHSIQGQLQILDNFSFNQSRCLPFYDFIYPSPTPCGNRINIIMPPSNNPLNI